MQIKDLKDIRSIPVCLDSHKVALTKKRYHYSKVSKHDRGVLIGYFNCSSLSESIYKLRIRVNDKVTSTKIIRL